MSTSRCWARARTTCCGLWTGFASTTASTAAPRRSTPSPAASSTGWRCWRAARPCSTAPRRWPAPSTSSPSPSRRRPRASWPWPATATPAGTSTETSATVSARARWWSMARRTSPTATKPSATRTTSRARPTGSAATRWRPWEPSTPMRRPRRCASPPPTSTPGRTSISPSPIGWLATSIPATRTWRR